MNGDLVIGRGKKHPAEVRDKALRLVRAGSSHRAAARAVGCSGHAVDVWAKAAGGVFKDQLGRAERNLSFGDREEISRGIASGESFAAIARRLGRPTSTLSREVNRNGGRRAYRAGAADHQTTVRARRPKALKLADGSSLAMCVEHGMKLFWSPEQIAVWLREVFPDDPEMWVSHETIYQSLFVQGRGALRAELAACLRTGRARRRPRAKAGAVGSSRGRIPNMVMISDRPAEIEDRAVPGHWEGDLIIGANSRSAIGTLVERTTRFTMLLYLPGRHGAEEVRAAMQAKIQTLPGLLTKSVTWDQGTEMAQHARFTIDTGIPVYFCDPHSPWMRGSNENTNGLLRQWFPKGTDLSVHSQAYLDEVANKLNGRPRKTLGWMSPWHELNALVAATT